MRPYQGLLAILLTFNSSDLKNSNNTLYEHRDGRFRRAGAGRRCGTSEPRSATTGRLAPRRGDPDVFEREPFILGITDGFVASLTITDGIRSSFGAGLRPDDVVLGRATCSRKVERIASGTTRSAPAATRPRWANRFIEHAPGQDHAGAAGRRKTTGARRKRGVKPCVSSLPHPWFSLAVDQLGGSVPGCRAAGLLGVDRFGRGPPSQEEGVLDRLKPGRSIASEVKRIVDKQLTLAIEELRAIGDRRSDERSTRRAAT